VTTGGFLALVGVGDTIPEVYLFEDVDPFG
jgi:hypothetical protein